MRVKVFIIAMLLSAASHAEVVIDYHGWKGHYPNEAIADLCQASLHAAWATEDLSQSLPKDIEDSLWDLSYKLGETAGALAGYPPDSDYCN